MAQIQGMPVRGLRPPRVKAGSAAAWAGACLLTLGVAAGACITAAARDPGRTWERRALELIDDLDAKLPGDPRVAELRKRLDAIRWGARP